MNRLIADFRQKLDCSILTAFKLECDPDQNWYFGMYGKINFKSNKCNQQVI